MNFNSNAPKLVLQSYPQITTNIKIVVEDDATFYLNAIPATTELANKKELQRSAIYDNTKYSILVSRFWKKLGLDSSSIFNAGDNSLYKSGAYILTNSHYNTTFGYFAPIWLSTNIKPDNFIIFKLKNFNYAEFTEEDLEIFYKEQLYKSEIVKVFDLTDTRLGLLFAELQSSVTQYTFEGSNDPRNINVNGLSIFSGYNNSISVPLDDVTQSINSQLLTVYPKAKLFSNKLYNFEFLFDDSANIELDSSIYFGAYFNKEDMCKFNINFMQHNIEMDKTISDIYQNTDNAFLLSNDNGVIIHTDTFDIDLSELFIYNCSNTGTDYGFYYNPYCPGTLDTTIAYDETDSSGYADRTFIDWVAEYGYNIDFWINCTYNYDYLNQGEGKYFYALKDRFKNIYNISSFGKDITLVNTSAYLDGFYGIDINRNLTIPGNILYTQSSNILKMQFKKSGINNLFDNGDWLQIKAGFNSDTFIWRIIVDKGNCCSGQEYCYYEASTINISSCNLKFIRHHNSIVLDVKFDRYVKFEEGDEIKLTCDSFKEALLTIQKVTYNYDDNTTSLIIVDFLGMYFRNCNSVRTMEFIYTGKSYYYTYFNPSGTMEELGKKIEYAFNVFPNRLYEVSEFQNKLIFKAIQSGYLFSNFNLDYDFTKSSTQPADIFINDKQLQGTPVFDSNLYELFYRNRGHNIWFTGGNSQSYGNRFYVDKTWALEHMDGTELIPLSNIRKTRIKNHHVENASVFYTAYTEEPVTFQNKILKYLDMDKYVTIDTLDGDSPISIGSNKVIQATYEFKPSLIKLLILNRGEI